MHKSIRDKVAIVAKRDLTQTVVLASLLKWCFSEETALTGLSFSNHTRLCLTSHEGINGPELDLLAAWRWYWPQKLSQNLQSTTICLLIVLPNFTLTLVKCEYFFICWFVYFLKKFAFFSLQCEVTVNLMWCVGFTAVSQHSMLFSSFIHSHCMVWF